MRSNGTETKKQRLGRSGVTKRRRLCDCGELGCLGFTKREEVGAKEGRDSEFVPLSSRRSHGEGNLRRAESVKRRQRGTRDWSDEGDGESAGGKGREDG